MWFMTPQQKPVSDWIEEDTWPKRANQTLAVCTHNRETQRSPPSRATEEAGDLGWGRESDHRLPRQEKPVLKWEGKGTQGEMKEFMESLRDSEKKPHFPFPRIPSNPVILFYPWFLRGFCVSLQQTPLCICQSLRASWSLQEREVPILDQTSSNGIFYYYTKSKLESQSPDSCV